MNKILQSKFTAIILGFIVGLIFSYLVFLKSFYFILPEGGSGNFSQENIFNVEILKFVLLEGLLGLFFYFIFKKINSVFALSFIIVYLLLIVFFNEITNSTSELCIPDCGVKTDVIYQ